MKPKGKWKPCGYIAVSRKKTNVVIMIADNITNAKKYYVAEIPEVLEALTKQTGYAKICRKET